MIFVRISVICCPRTLRPELGAFGSKDYHAVTQHFRCGKSFIRHSENLRTTPMVVQFSFVFKLLKLSKKLSQTNYTMYDLCASVCLISLYVEEADTCSTLPATERKFR